MTGAGINEFAVIFTDHRVAPPSYSPFEKDGRMAPCVVSNKLLTVVVHRFRKSVRGIIQ